MFWYIMTSMMRVMRPVVKKIAVAYLTANERFYLSL